LLDTAFVVPGTSIRIGLDALLGLMLPGAGDAGAALLTAAFVWVGFRRGVPKVILWRMLFNLGLDAAVGAIPLVGDVFDVFHRAASKNLTLLRRHSSAEVRPRAGDYVFVSVMFLALAALLLLPLLMLAGVIYGLVGWVG
jgi:hypothetical protein